MTISYIKKTEEKETVMLGKFMGEALGEGAFLGLLKHAWGWAGRLVGFLGVGDVAEKKVGDEIKKRITNPKGWNDEHFFALDLAEIKADREKKIMIQEAMLDVQKLDDKNGTHYARNFRLIVTLHDQDDVVKGTPGSPEVPAVPATPAKPAMPATPAIPATATSPAIPAKSAKPAIPAVPGTPAKPAVPATPASKRPGIIILQDLADTCDDKMEVFMRIVAAGMLQDWSTNFEMFMHYGKKFLKEGSKSLQCEIDKRSGELAARSKAYRELPLWKRILNS